MKAIIYKREEYWGYEILDDGKIAYTEYGFEMKEDAKAAAKIEYPGIFLLVEK